MRCAVLDLIEDRVRSRTLAVILVFACCIPIIALIRPHEHAPVGNDTITESVGPAMLSFAGFSRPLSAMCMTEASCVQAAGLVSHLGQSAPCPTECLSALGFVLTTETRPLPPPYPHLPPNAPPPPNVHEEDTELVYLIIPFIAVAMLGNSAYSPLKVCVPVSLLAVAMMVALIFVLFGSTWGTLRILWLAASIGALLLYASMAVGALVKCKTGKAPTGKLACLVADFSDYRQDAYHRYVVELLKNRSPAGGDAQRELDKGKATGNLTWSSKHALEKAIREHKAQRYGLVANVKALIGFSKRAEAVFVPMRFAISTSAAFVLLILLAQFWVRLGEIARSNLHYIANTYLLDALRIVDTTAADVQTLTGIAPSPGLGVRGAIAFAYEHTNGAAEAVYASTVVTSAITLFLFCIATVMLLGSFRSSVLRARVGDWEFNPKHVTFKKSWSFVGGHIANAFVSFFMIGILLGLVVFVLAWTFTYWLVGFLFTGPYRHAVIGAIGGVIFHTALKMVLFKCLAGKRVIKLRFSWMASACCGLEPPASRRTRASRRNAGATSDPTHNLL